MNIRELRAEALEEAGLVAQDKFNYYGPILGGVLRGITTKSVVNGLNYTVWGIGTMMVWNVAGRLVINKIYS